ncbi:endothelin-converting enzyme 1-like isoform X3 [Lampetra fluviatilis]
MEMEAAGLAALLEEGSRPPARYPWLQCVCAKRHGAHVECVKSCLRMGTWRWRCLLWALTAVLTLALTGCVVALMLPPRATAGDVQKWRTCTTSHCMQAVSAMWEALNSSGDPCEDFYGFSCGRWLQGSEQPTGKPHRGTWQELDKNNQLAMHRFLENATIKETDAERKVQRFYLSCLNNSSSRTRLGSRSLNGIISQLGGWHGGLPTTTTTTGATTGDAELQQLLQLLGRNFSLGAFFKLGVGSLPFDSKQRALRLSVPDLGLPSPDYYLNKTADDKVLTAYLDFMVRVRQLLDGADERAASSDMRLVLQLESRLAGIMALTGSSRNPGFITFRDLQDMLPLLDWTQYFREVFYPLAPYGQRTVVIDNKEYFHGAFHVINNTDRRVLRLYALWSLVRQLLPSLDGRYEDAKQDLMVAIHGADNVESRARWEFCVEETNRALPLGLGALYARATFNATQRRTAEDIVTRIRNAFVSNLDSIAWMDGKTRAAAKEKGGEFRQNWRRHRPRSDSRVRRPRPEVRRPGSDACVVVERVARRLQAAQRLPGGALRALGGGGRRGALQRPADPGGERRRPGRHQDGIPGLRDVDRGEGRGMLPASEESHRPANLLHSLLSGVVLRGDGGGPPAPAPAAGHSQPRARPDAGVSVQLCRVRRHLQLPRGVADEPAEQVRRLVTRGGAGRPFHHWEACGYGALRAHWQAPSVEFATTSFRDPTVPSRRLGEWERAALCVALSSNSLP